ncbi:MAG: hypothetical protein ACMUJM_16710 [bacterium]
MLIDADEYLKHLSRYIHLNPVRAKMVSLPAEHRWSTYCAYIGHQKVPVFLETNCLLSSFGKSKKEARRNYKQLVENVDIKVLENPSKYLIEGFILGDTDFVNWIKERFLSGRQEEKKFLN